MICEDSGQSNALELSQLGNDRIGEDQGRLARIEHRICPQRPWLDLGLVELFGARELIALFARRALTLRYRQTLLGVGWAVLQPLLSSGVLALVFGHFAGLSGAQQDTPYVLSVYAALLPWLLFAQSAQRAALILASERTLLTKTWMPRMVLPLSSIAALCVDVLVALAFYLLLATLCGRPPGLNALWLPLLFVPALAFTTGVTLLLSVLNVYYRDVRNALPFLLQVGFFLTPVAYAAERVPGAWSGLLWLNPLAGQVEAFRWALLGQGGEFPRALWLASCALSLLSLVLGVVVFRRVERELADVI
jgi:lipopolysaccharide transport system permease protein